MRDKETMFQSVSLSKRDVAERAERRWHLLKKRFGE